MAVYKVKLKRAPVTANLELMQNSFIYTSNRRIMAVRALELCERRLPVTEWTVLALVGVFVREYEKAYGHRLNYAGTLLDVLNILDDLQERVGVDNARKAIVAVFHPSLKWMKNKLSSLKSDKVYFQWLVPLMDETEQVKGEQAEWRGQRLESGAMEVAL